MFMNQISLKTLRFYFRSALDYDLNFIQNIPFATYLGTMDCLKNLLELDCYSNISSEFFYQLFQTCHHIQSLRITIRGNTISNGLTKLISIQQNLKYLKISNDPYFDNFKKIVPSLTNLSNTLIKLDIHLENF